MDDALYRAALVYQTLLQKDYHVVAAYKTQRISFTFYFMPHHFYHLVGFQKLLDRRNLTPPGLLYRKVLAREITTESIAGSAFFDDMKARLQDFGQITEIIDALKTGKIVIEFSQQRGTRIQADYLLYREQERVYAHLFLRSDCDGGYVPCSFFCREDDRYIRNNKKYRVQEFSVKVHK